MSAASPRDDLGRAGAVVDHARSGDAPFGRAPLSRREFVAAAAGLGGVAITSAIGWPGLGNVAAAATTFPTTPILDTFNRPNSPVLGPNWIGAQEGHRQLAVMSAAAGCPTYDIGADVWAPGGSIAAEGPDSEIYCQLKNVTAGSRMCITLYARTQAPALKTTVTAYLLQIFNYHFRLYYCLNGNTNIFPLSNYINQKVSPGDKWGLSCVGTTITGWYGPGGVWQSTPIVSAQDGHITGAGGLMVSVGYECRITDFGGGTASGA